MLTVMLLQIFYVSRGERENRFFSPITRMWSIFESKSASDSSPPFVKCRSAHAKSTQVELLLLLHRQRQKCRNLYYTLKSHSVVSRECDSTCLCLKASDFFRDRSSGRHIPIVLNTEVFNNPIVQKLNQPTSSINLLQGKTLFLISINSFALSSLVFELIVWETKEPWVNSLALLDTKNLTALL